MIHIWGTEYGHTLAMLRVCRRLGLLDRTVVSIQGLCSVYARHYAEGIPASVYWSTTLRDLLRLDNIPAQQRKYVQRGRMELEALGLARHVIGRTPWDKACTQALAEKAQYHFCNESLREPFYEGQWRLGACRRRTGVFASSLETPIKGFHYLLEALTQVLRRYPDATLAVPGKSFFPPDPKAALKQQTYHRYLCRYARAHGLEGKIEFLGFLSPEDMKREFLQSPRLRPALHRGEFSQRPGRGHAPGSALRGRPCGRGQHSAEGPGRGIPLPPPRSPCFWPAPSAGFSI